MNLHLFLSLSVSDICVFTSFLGAFADLRKVIMSFVMSVYPSVRMVYSAPTGRISITFDI